MLQGQHLDGAHRVHESRYGDLRGFLTDASRGSDVLFDS